MKARKKAIFRNKKETQGTLKSLNIVMEYCYSNHCKHLGLTKVNLLYEIILKNQIFCSG